MEEELKIGLKGAASALVTRENTALMVKSGGLLVLSTPAMVALMEQAAYESAEKCLPEADTTVGISLNISHNAATLIGRDIRAESELTAIEGRKLTFNLKAYDDAGLIGEGTHERFVVNRDRFIEKASRR